MDPLTIGSAVVGLIAAASRIGPVLHNFITHTRDAPKSASQIMEEMNSVTSALERLQAYLMGASRSSVARRSLLSLRNIVATLTACVTTYSDLERVMQKCVSNGEVWRAMWIFHETEVIDLLQRVQAHKLSLTFMLIILQCESMQEAEDSMNRLTDRVEYFISTNADLRVRIDALAANHDSSLAPASRLMTMQAPLTTSSGYLRPFEEDLSKSPVYRKLRPRDSIYSISTSQRDSIALSAFSKLSMSNISVVAVFSLPIWSTDLANAAHYRFGKEGLTLTTTELARRYPHINFPNPDSLNPEDEALHDDASSITTQIPYLKDKLPEIKRKLHVLFMAASLCELNLSGANKREEGGIPYLEYGQGEMFDVIGVRGELWLARNQHNKYKSVGWIWEKHFAEVASDQILRVTSICTTFS